MTSLHHIGLPHHSKGLNEVLSGLQSDAEHGLPEDEAQRRLARNGPNRMTARRGTPAWRKFLEQPAQPVRLPEPPVPTVALFHRGRFHRLGSHRDVRALCVIAPRERNTIGGLARDKRRERIKDGRLGIDDRSP